jgi:hypothetical protein
MLWRFISTVGDPTFVTQLLLFYARQGESISYRSIVVTSRYYGVCLTKKYTVSPSEPRLRHGCDIRQRSPAQQDERLQTTQG